MSCIIEYEGSEYKFVKDSSNKYWVGHKRLGGVNFIGENVVAPMIVQSMLLKAAIAAGFPMSMFSTPAKEKRTSTRSSTPRKASSKRNSISIF